MDPVKREPDLSEPSEHGSGGLKVIVRTAAPHEQCPPVEVTLAFDGGQAVTAWLDKDTAFGVAMDLARRVIALDKREREERSG